MSNAVMAIETSQCGSRLSLQSSNGASVRTGGSPIGRVAFFSGQRRGGAEFGPVVNVRDEWFYAVTAGLRCAKADGILQPKCNLTAERGRVPKRRAQSPSVRRTTSAKCADGAFMESCNMCYPELEDCRPWSWSWCRAASGWWGLIF